MCCCVGVSYYLEVVKVGCVIVVVDPVVEQSGDDVRVRRAHALQRRRRRRQCRVLVFQFVERPCQERHVIRWDRRSRLIMPRPRPCPRAVAVTWDRYYDYISLHSQTPSIGLFDMTDKMFLGQSTRKSFPSNPTKFTELAHTHVPL